MKTKEEILIRNREWKKINKEKVRLYNEAWRKSNPDYSKTYHSILENREREYELKKAKRKLKPRKSRIKKSKEELLASKRKRHNAETIRHKAEKLKRTPKWADLEAIKQFYINCPDGYEVDHIIPLRGKTVSGLHVIDNLQYLTAKENRKKANKF